MKETIKTSRAVGFLEKAFRALNEDKFNGELETPIITIQSTPSAYGHVTCGKVWHGKDDNRQYELNIGAGTLDRPIENTISTLLHEMVHIYNLMNNIQDCSRGGKYHNKKFRDKAVSVGLVIEHDDKYGWTITSPSEELLDYIIEKGWSDIKIGRNDGFRIALGGGSPSGNGVKVKKPSSTRKYVCPCCGQSVRATKIVNIICGDCCEKMVLVD